MEFTKYNSIENSNKKKFIKKAIELKLNDCDFVVQEKIHGTNFGIYLSQFENEPISTKYASRKQFVPQDDIFYNYKTVATKYKNNFEQVFKEIQSTMKLYDLSLVIIYGELYGGGYPHKDVKPIPDVIKVQKEVQYCPHTDFMAFDIRVNGLYLSVDETNSIFQKCGIPYCETLFRGSLEECLQYPNDFESTIYKKHNLPPITDYKNICEGVVIKPIEPRFFGGGNRFILKNKNAKFKETKVKKAQPKNKTKLSDEAQDKLTDLLSHVTENRLSNVLSKLTDTEKKERRNILREMHHDVHEESQKFEDNIIDFKTLEKWEQKELNKILYGAINILFEKYSEE